MNAFLSKLSETITLYSSAVYYAAGLIGSTVFMAVGTVFYLDRKR